MHVTVTILQSITPALGQISWSCFKAENVAYNVAYNVFLLSTTKLDTSYILYKYNGILAGKHNFVVLSNLLCFSSVLKLGPFN